MGPVSSGSSIERRLKDVYVPALMQTGMSASQANDVFSGWLSQAKEESRKEDMDNLPQNFGDLLLQNEAAGPNIQAWLAKVRREGGTDEDIRNWWNLHDLERRIMLKNDEHSRMAVVMDSLEKMGATKETVQELMDKAVAHARKYSELTCGFKKSSSIPITKRNLNVQRHSMRWSGEKLPKAIFSRLCIQEISCSRLDCPEGSEYPPYRKDECLHFDRSCGQYEVAKPSSSRLVLHSVAPRKHAYGIQIRRSYCSSASIRY
jgi:hypothetical protein